MTLLTAHHLLPHLREELALLERGVEPELHLGDDVVGVRPGDTRYPPQGDPHFIIDVKYLRCEGDVPTVNTILYNDQRRCGVNHLKPP